VLELNHADGGDRRFIMVQLPEKTGNKEFPTIADSGKHRIRWTIEQIKAAVAGSLALNAGQEAEDLGFKVFRLTAPNIQQWRPDAERDPDAYAEKLSLFNDPLIAGWKSDNVIWEVALREGLGLNSAFNEKVLANGNKVYQVSDPDSGQRFVICLDGKITSDITKHYELKADDLFVCRDIALDDSAAANLALQCRLKTI